MRCGVKSADRVTARSMRVIVPVLFLIAAPSVALAQMDAGTNGCGAVTEQGFCTGDTLTYCDVDSSTVVVVDCATELGGMATCIEIDPVYGVDCAAAGGEECVVEDEEGNLFTLFCQGTNAGCLDTVSTSSCAPNIGPCVEADIGGCDGTRLMLDCAINQPWLLDCAAVGATCDETSSACVGVPEGGLCDDQTLVCAAGFVCNQNNECAVPTADAGVADSGANDAAGPPDTGVRADAGVGLFDTGVSSRADGGGGSEEESGCGCDTTDLRPSALWLFVPALFALRLRRSR